MPVIENLPDSVLSASSYLQHALNHDPTRSRLHTVAHETGVGAWVPDTSESNHWIQVNIQSAKQVFKVATQGRNDDTGYDNQWVTSYQLKYSLTGVEADFVYVTSPTDGAVETFIGNTDRDTIKENEFPEVSAQFVRLYPQTWNEHLAMRWEVYACVSGGVCTEINVANTAVSSSAVLPGTTVEISCLSGFSFGAIHDEQMLSVTCQDDGTWDVDLEQATCFGKQSDDLCFKQYSLCPWILRNFSATELEVIDGVIFLD